MQNLLNKKETVNHKENKPQKQEGLIFSDIEKLYKGKNSNLIGLEYERLSLDKNTFKNASYEKVSKIIETMAEILNWELVYDNETIIGAKSNSITSISLEPGMQFEISIKPHNSILDMDLELTKIVELSNKIASYYDVIFLGYGISPITSADDIEILNKRRYQIMNKYLPYCKKGELCPSMMRKTAGIQINLDYKDNIDCFNKLKFYNLIMPYMTALLANSPFENNILSDKKTLRANCWLFTGENRCNLFYKNIFRGFHAQKNIIKNYINEILKVPMVYIERNNEIIPVEGKINFETFLKEGFSRFSATLDDYILHQSLIFPDIRLKNYIEIRNHDSSNPHMALALAAFYKGLNLCDFEYLNKKFDYLNIDDIENIGGQIISYGLDIKIETKNKTLSGWDIIGDLFSISLKNLNAKDRIYLTPVKEIIKSKKTNADYIIDYNIQNPIDLVEFLNS